MGGYGRGRLSPHSDVDLLFIWGGKVETDVSKAAMRELLYPLWDAGFQVGHAVTTAKGAIERAHDDLHAATSLLSARFIAGAQEPFDEMLDRRNRWIDKNRRPLVRRLLNALEERHARVERAGWVLAPELKDDIGGLRDADHLDWMGDITAADGDETVERARAVLLAAREALHAVVRRKSDRLRIDLQVEVAEKLGLDGLEGADRLMESVHGSARVIELKTTMGSQERAMAVLGGPRRTGNVLPLGPGLRVEDGTLTVRKISTPADALRALIAHARTRKPLNRMTFEAIADVFGAPGPFWDDELREAFAELLAAPSPGSALELLELSGGWSRLIPEWDRIRGRVQHDPYHRFTVDGHSFVAVSMVSEILSRDPVAAAAAREAGDLEALYLATLIHDIGKGSHKREGEDHSVIGERLAKAVCSRMGYGDGFTEEVATLVRHHLLLSDTATRRDIDDGLVIGTVAEAVGSARLARLLYILSIADGLATGPHAWNDWKASLVTELYRRVIVAIETGERPTRSDAAARSKELEAFDPLLATSAAKLLETLPPSYLEATQVEDIADDMRLLLRRPGPGEAACNILAGWEADHWVVTVCVVDRPGALARTAGVLALHHLPVRTASAYSTTEGLGLQRFVVAARRDQDWDRLRADIVAAYSGRLALDARLGKKLIEYGAPPIEKVEVRVLHDVSEHSTVIEVRAPDTSGLLYAIASALGDLDADIHVAKIDTLGERVVDVFYVRSPSGSKLDEPQTQEITRAIQHRVAHLLP